MWVAPYHDRDYSTNTNVMQAAGLITFVKTTKEPDLLTLAGRLKWAREQRKLSQVSLAALAKVAQGTIGNLESGERKSARKLLSIARVLRVHPDWLESGKGEWDDAKGTVFHAPSPEEMAMLSHWRNLLDSDRRVKTAEIAALAKERLAQREEVFAETGYSRIVEGAAQASRQRTARATVEAGTAALKQRSLLGD